MTFQIQARQTTVGAEIRGGVTTFLTMAYILFANAAILAPAGLPAESVAAATAAAAALCSLLMGLGANFPMAMAPGMGLNAVVAYQVATQTGSWQTAMGLVVLDGVVVLGLVLCGVREAVMQAIPVDLRRAISVGIGLFIALIGAVNARLVVVPASSLTLLGQNALATVPPVTHGTLHAAEPLIALGGLLVIAVLLTRRVVGAMVIGIGLGTIVGLILGVSSLPSTGWIGLPRFETVFQADVRSALNLAFLPLLVSIVIVDFFDTIGTVTAVAEEAKLEEGSGRIPFLRRILAIDAIGAVVGGLFGVSTVTCYIESAAGVAEGARTGLHSVVVAVLFLLCMFVAPLVAMVPAAATAPALMVVGFLMCQQIARMDFLAPETGIPAFLIMLMIPLTYSISHGIGFGFIGYVMIEVLRARASQVHPLMYAAAGVFVAYFALS